MTQEVAMFAPHCPACQRRVLLSTDRIVRFASTGGGRHLVVLRCDCGELLDWDQQPPAPHDAAVGAVLERA